MRRQPDDPVNAAATLAARLCIRSNELSPAELRVARYFAAHREEVLIASAVELAAKARTSDATVIRTAKSLGYAGLDALRRNLARELRQEPSPAGRIARTLDEVGGDCATAFAATLDMHLESVEALRRGISPTQFTDMVDHVLGSCRVAIFGIGPSGALATYLAVQLRRFGLAALTLSDTGLLLADGLLQLRAGDVLVILAYGRIYPELEALFARAEQLGLVRILLTDTLRRDLEPRCSLVLDIPRGRTDAFSTHTATLAFIEALLVGVAARRPRETIEALSKLNRLRADIAGDLPAL
jgi:DNA-binding MurR/RpiR family transcriptional regulator